jgi:hypothetical protein
MMRTLDARPIALLGALIAGSALTLVVMAAAGSSPAIWVAVAGASACACGVVVGSTARVLPAAALAGVAGAALVLAVGASGDGTGVEVRPLVASPVVAADEARSSAVAADVAPSSDAAVATSATAPVAARPVPAPVTAPQFVRRFYAALNAGDFERAWKRLGPAVQARSASFDAWQAGYTTTVSQRIEDLRVEAGDMVRHTLVTVDRTPCGTTTERRFEMLWYLQRDGRTFTARDLVGVQLAGVDPAAAC